MHNLRLINEILDPNNIRARRMKKERILPIYHSLSLKYGILDRALLVFLVNNKDIVIRFARKMTSSNTLEINFPYFSDIKELLLLGIVDAHNIKNMTMNGKNYFDINFLDNNKYFCFIDPLDNTNLVFYRKFANNHVSIPRFIRFKKNNLSLFEFFGAYFCEGWRHSIKKVKSVDFTNAESEQILFWINSLKSFFNIKKEDLCYNLNLRRSHEKSDDECLNYWSNKLKISSNKIKINRGGKDLNKDIIGEYGYLTVRYHKIVFSEIFLLFLQEIKRFVLSNKKSAIYFLRGLGRGDLSPATTYERLIGVNITGKYSEDMDFCIKLFDKIGIKTKLRKERGYYSLSAYNWEDLTKLILFDTFKGHPRRRLRMILTYLNRSYTFLLFNYLKLFKKPNYIKNLRRISPEDFKIGEKFIRRLYRLNILNYKKIKLINTYRPVNIIFLTKKGWRLYNTIESFLYPKNENE